MFKCPNGFNGFSCPHAAECLKPGQTQKTFKVQIKDDLRIYGTPTTPKGSLQWKNDFNKELPSSGCSPIINGFAKWHHF